MPQTSPMNWTVLSTLSMMSIMLIIINNKEKASQSKNKKKAIKSAMKSWNW